MSKRFGRNQRRKMRAEVAALEQSVANYQQTHEMDRGLLAHMAERNARSEATIRRVAKVLGEHFIALDPMAIALEVDPGWKIRVALDMRHRALEMCAPDDAPVPSFLRACEFVELALVRGETTFDTLRRQMHAIVSWGDCRSAYAISEKAMYEISRRNPEEQVRYIAVVLTKHLLNAIREMFHVSQHMREANG